MWTDEHGSEVLTHDECHRLLASGAATGAHGHLGFRDSGAPTVLPLDYAVDGGDVVVLVGEGLRRRVAGDQMVAFLVDGLDDGRAWSVLVRGHADDAPPSPPTPTPVPRAPIPGHRLLRITADVVTGRRFTPRPTTPAP